jgi:hypothetical protein
VKNALLRKSYEKLDEPIKAFEAMQQEFELYNSGVDNFAMSIGINCNTRNTLNHRINTFTFYSRNQSPRRRNTGNEIERNRTRNNSRGRSKTRNNNNRRRAPSAVRNKSRPPRGHIRINPVASLVETYSLGSRGNMTYSTAEIGKMRNNAYTEIKKTHGSIEAFRESVKNATAIAKEAAAK